MAAPLHIILPDEVLTLPTPVAMVVMTMFGRRWLTHPAAFCVASYREREKQ